MSDPIPVNAELQAAWAKVQERRVKDLPHIAAQVHPECIAAILRFFIDSAITRLTDIAADPIFPRATT